MKLGSNLFFLIPFALAVSAGFYLYSTVILTVFFLSLAFHLREENKILYYWDMFFSLLLMFANFLLLFAGHWALPWSAFAVICAALAIFFFRGRPDMDENKSHGLWHIFSAGVSLFCLLSVI
jgi:hypothetical protein